MGGSWKDKKECISCKGSGKDKWQRHLPCRSCYGKGWDWKDSSDRQKDYLKAYEKKYGKKP